MVKFALIPSPTFSTNVVECTDAMLGLAEDIDKATTILFDNQALYKRV